MKKKVVGCILTAMMITGMFTGCGNSESQSGDGTNTGSGDQVVVDIFQNKNEISDALQAAIEQYESENPGVTIHLETVGGSDYASSLKAKMLGNDPVEIFTLGLSLIHI